MFLMSFLVLLGVIAYILNLFTCLFIIAMVRGLIKPIGRRAI
jgi:hypothetical protein